MLDRLRKLCTIFGAKAKRPQTFGDSVDLLLTAIEDLEEARRDVETQRLVVAEAAAQVTPLLRRIQELADLASTTTATPPADAIKPDPEKPHDYQNFEIV